MWGSKMIFQLQQFSILINWYNKKILLHSLVHIEMKKYVKKTQMKPFELVKNLLEVILITVTYVWKTFSFPFL